MKHSLVILSESLTPDTLYPFSILHPVFELRCGAQRLFEKVERTFPDATLLAHGRSGQVASFCARFGNISSLNAVSSEDELRTESDIWVISAHCVMTQALRRRLENELAQLCAVHGAEIPFVFTNDAIPFAAYYSSQSLVSMLCDRGAGKTARVQDVCSLLANPASSADDESNSFGKSIRLEIPEARIITYLWDTLRLSGEEIQHDAEYTEMNGVVRATGFPGVFMRHPENISIGENVDIAPCVVIDARKGAVIIGNNVEIQPHTSIFGPCFIGNNTLVKAGSRLYEGTALGEYSKVAGELKNTIFQGFGNKQHEGCLGYSFISEWVNLGAGTDVSDLKNNYGSIRVRFSSNAETEMDTGLTSLGLLAGDHTKSAINTSFTTGTITGISANVFDSAGATKKYIPSFSWGGEPNSPLFDEEKAIALARTVMARRNRILINEEEMLLRAEYRRCLAE